MNKKRTFPIVGPAYMRATTIPFEEVKNRWLQDPEHRAACDAIQDQDALDGVELYAHTWNYRVIEFDGADGEPWRAIHEVHYVNGVPDAYSSTPASVTWYPAEDGWEDPRQQLDRLAAALNKPILRPADFHSEEPEAPEIRAP